MNTPVPASARRHVVVGFTVAALTLAFTDRVNLAVAAVAMRSQLHWSQSVKGLVLAAFFVGYLVFQMASGALAQRFGGKRVLGIAVLSWSAFALLTPLAATTSVAVLLLVRIALGIGEAAVVPASYELFSRWVPAMERGRAVGRFLCGIPLGQIAGFALTGYLTASYGWPASFYLFGALGVLWALVFLRAVHNDPAHDPKVSAAERALLPVPAGRRARAHALAAAAVDPDGARVHRRALLPQLGAVPSGVVAAELLHRAPGTAARRGPACTPRSPGSPTSSRCWPAARSVTRSLPAARGRSTCAGLLARPASRA